MAAEQAAPAGAAAPVEISQRSTLLVRMFGWGMLGLMAAFLINNYLTFWLGWPGSGSPFGIIEQGAEKGPAALGWAQLAIYPLMVVLGVLFVMKTGERDLRTDSTFVSDINAFMIRFAFFAVLYIGAVDAVISFMRVEDLLPPVFGEALALDLGKSQFRGPYVHIPLTILGLVTAVFTRTLGFTWLAVLIVVAELLIVISRFIFSYEQVFMGDLVRFWYAALFLFASAHTLLEEGHVRVDVFYAAFGPRKKGKVNAFGSIFLGMTLCWVILLVGMGGKNSVINSPVLGWETTQTGFSMYVKYMMAGYLAVFAISMMIQFVSYMLEAVADMRGEPGGRDHDSTAAH